MTIFCDCKFCCECVATEEDDVTNESFALEWDRDYGILHRSGWTVKWDGHILAELERFLIVALWKAWRGSRAIQAYRREEAQ